MAKKRLPEISEEDSIEKILKNLELVKEDKLTNAVLLLFGKNLKSISTVQVPVLEDLKLQP